MVYHFNQLGVCYANFDKSLNYEIFIIDGPSLIRKNDEKPLNADLYHYYKKNFDRDFIDFLDIKNA